MERSIRFWGVRGSISAPGLATMTVGGNTSCLEVRLGEDLIVIDGGTGLRALGAHLGVTPVRGTILFSHLHWDHIQGVPFFVPLFHPASEVTLVGPTGLEEVLMSQMSRPTFPVGMDVFPANIHFVTVAPHEELDLGGVRVTTAPLNHPGGAIGYRVTDGEVSMAYGCDHEVGEIPSPSSLADLVRGTDVAVLDAQYLPEEYPARIGWGHSTYAQDAEIARAARVGQLLLTHHEPTRTDTQVAKIERHARRLFPASRAAREGMVIRMEPGGVVVDEAAIPAFSLSSSDRAELAEPSSTGSQVETLPPAPDRGPQE